MILSEVAFKESWQFIKIIIIDDIKKQLLYINKKKNLKINWKLILQYSIA